MSPSLLVIKAVVNRWSSFLNLTPAQCRMMANRYHIYLPENGRINISGLSLQNVSSVARAIDEVVRVGAEAKLSARLA